MEDWTFCCRYTSVPLDGAALKQAVSERSIRVNAWSRIWCNMEEPHARAEQRGLKVVFFLYFNFRLGSKIRNEKNGPQD